MPDAISQEALPGWRFKDVKAEEVTLLACLLGKHVTRHQDELNEQPLTGPFGHALLFYEVLRHDNGLVELTTKLRREPDNDQWRCDPDYLTVFTDKIGLIISTPGFPHTPFLSLDPERQNELIERFTGGQPGVEIASIEMVDAMGILERFTQLATLAGEGRQHKQPEGRFKQDAILQRERLNPGESVYDTIFTIRAHMGIEAAREGFEQWLKDNHELFPGVDTSIAAQNWQDPRTILSDLAVLRLVHLHGYHGAREWTRKHRPRQRVIMPRPEDYESYFVEGKKVKGNRPLYEDRRQYEAAIRRVLAQISKH